MGLGAALIISSLALLLVVFRVDGAASMDSERANGLVEMRQPRLLAVSRSNLADPFVLNGRAKENRARHYKARQIVAYMFPQVNVPQYLCWPRFYFSRRSLFLYVYIP